MKKAWIGLLVIVITFTLMLATIIIKRDYIFTNEKFYTQKEVNAIKEETYDDAVKTHSDEALMNKLNELQIKKFELELEIDTLKKQDEINKATITSLENQIDGLNCKISSLNAQKTELENQVETDNETLESLNIQIEELKNEILNLETDIESLNTNLTSLISERDNLVQDIEDKNTNIVSLNNQIAVLQSEKTTLENNISELTLEIEQYHTTVTEKDDEIARLQGSIKVYEDYIAGEESDSEVFAIFTLEDNVYAINKSTKNGLAYLENEPQSTDIYIFNGWKVNGEYVDLSTYKLTCNTTFEADIVYLRHVYYIADGVSCGSSLLKDGEYIETEVKAPEKSGYTFMGWSLDGVNVVTTVGTEVRADITYYAVYSEQPYFTTVSIGGPSAFVSTTGSGSGLSYDFWTDGLSTYFSYGSTHYVLDRETCTWSIKNWNGLTSFYGNDIWTDGADIYYSSGTSHYVLDKDTSTWSEMIWSGLTSFYGFNVVQTDESIFYVYSSDLYVLSASTLTWNKIEYTETPPSGLTGYCCWTDGKNLYYSAGGTVHYILDLGNNVWNKVTWSIDGLDSGSLYGSYIFNVGEDTYLGYGYYIYKLNSEFKSWTLITDTTQSLSLSAIPYTMWTDSENAYYTFYNSSSQRDINYEFNLATGVWAEKTWRGLTQIDGDYVWTDGYNTYYSKGENCQYVWDKENRVWRVKTWGSYTPLYGNCVWYNGQNYVYSYDDTHYIFFSGIGALGEPVVSVQELPYLGTRFTGLTNFRGCDIWGDGINIYYSSGVYDELYKLESDGFTWVKQSCTAMLDGSSAFTDGTYFYFVDYNESAMGNVVYRRVDPSTLDITVIKDFPSDFHMSYVFTIDNTLYMQRGDVCYKFDKDTTTFVKTTKFNGLDNQGRYMWTDGTNIYYSHIGQESLILVCP